MAERVLPPGPPASLFGMARVALSALSDPYAALLRCERELGPTFTLPMPDGPVVVTSTPEGARALFTSDPATLAPMSTATFRTFLGESSLLALEGERHRVARKAIAPRFHGASCATWAARITQVTRRHCDGVRAGEAFAAQDLFERIALDLMIELVFGIRDPARAAALRDRVRAWAHVSPSLVLVPALQRSFFGRGPWADWTRARDAIREAVMEEVAIRRAGPTDASDILSMLLAARYDDGSALDDTELFHQLTTMVAAGYETTATTLAWAVHHLLDAPEVLATLKTELTAASRAPLLDAAIDETMRLAPVFVLVGRRLGIATDIDGYRIPAGIAVASCPLLLHRREASFVDASRFRPERFLEGRRFSPFEHAPFGGGSRRCLGASFAVALMRTVLAETLRTMTLVRADTARVHSVLHAGTVGPSRGVRVMRVSATSDRRRAADHFERAREHAGQGDRHA